MLKKIIVSFLVLILISQTTFAALNYIPEISELVKKADDKAVEKWILDDQSNKVDNTANVQINIDENSITRDASTLLLGNGSEAFTGYEICVDPQTGELTNEWKEFADTLYDVPVVRFGGHSSNYVNLIKQVGPMSGRMTSSHLKDIGFERYYPEYGKTPFLEPPKTLESMGTVEFIKTHLAINPDTKFIFNASISHAYPEDNANFVRFCLDDKNESEWGALRASCGLDKPINLICIELGNEMYYNPDYGEEINKSKREWYVETFRKHMTAIHKFYPDLPCSPCIAMNGLGSEDKNGEGFESWNRYVIKELGNECKIMTFHLYYSGYELGFTENWIHRTMQKMEEEIGPDHGIKLAITEHSKWCSNDYVAAATLESALATTQFLNRMYQLDDIIWCANYFTGTSSRWAQFRKAIDGKLVESAVGKMYKVYLDGLGDRVVKSDVQSDNSKIGDITSAENQKFSVLVTAKGENELKIIMSNREPYTDIDLTFSTKNNYTLVDETVFTAPNQYSFVYNQNTQNVFTTTTNIKNIANFKNYKMPTKSMVVLTLKSDKIIPQLGNKNNSINNGEAKYDGENLFSDLEFHWAKNEINIMSESKIVNGTSSTSFEPDRKITRAEFAVAVNRLLGLDGNNIGIVFNDISDSDWYRDSIAAVTFEGFMRCGEGGEFAPEKNLTLQEAVEAVYRICGSKLNDINVDNSEKYTQKIQNNYELTDWSKNAIAFAIRGGILNKFYETSNYNPENDLTRAEATVILYRIKTIIGL